MEQTGTYRISFKPDVSLAAVEDTLVVAAIAAESLLGRATFKLDATFRLDKEARVCVVDARTIAGQHIARIFVGLLAQVLGEGVFIVEREGTIACAAGGQC